MRRPISLQQVEPRLDDAAALEYILLGDLRDLLEDPLDEINVMWLKAVIDALLETMPRHFALQDEGGYLQDVIECDPNWYSYVRRLSGERSRIYRKLGVLRGGLEQTCPKELDSSELRSDLRLWMVHWTSFQRHERRLVQTAFNLDVGIAD